MIVHTRSVVRSSQTIAELRDKITTRNGMVAKLMAMPKLSPVLTMLDQVLADNARDWYAIEQLIEHGYAK